MQGLYAAHRKHPFSTNNTQGRMPFQAPLHLHDRGGATPIGEEQDPARVMTVLDAHAINFDLFCMGRASLLGPNGSPTQTLANRSSPPSKNNSRSSSVRVVEPTSVPVTVEDEDTRPLTISNVFVKNKQRSKSSSSKCRSSKNHHGIYSKSPAVVTSPPQEERPVPRATSSDLLEALARSAAAAAAAQSQDKLSRTEPASPRVVVVEDDAGDDEPSSPPPHPSSPPTTRHSSFKSPSKKNKQVARANAASTMGIARSPWQQERQDTSSPSQDEEEIDMSCFFFPPPPPHHQDTGEAAGSNIHRLVSNDEDDDDDVYHHHLNVQEDSFSDSSSTSDTFSEQGSYSSDTDDDEDDDACYELREDDNDDDEWVSIRQHHREQQQHVLGAFDEYVRQFHEEDRLTDEHQVEDLCFQSILHSSPTKSLSSSSSSEDDSLLSLYSSSRRFSSLESIKEESEQDLDSDNDEAESISFETQPPNETDRQQPDLEQDARNASSLLLDEVFEEQLECVAHLDVPPEAYEDEDFSIPDHILSLLDGLETPCVPEDARQVETPPTADESCDEYLQVLLDEECEKLESFTPESDKDSLEFSKQVVDELAVPDLVESDESESSADDERLLSGHQHSVETAVLPTTPKRKKKTMDDVFVTPRGSPIVLRDEQLKHQAVVTTSEGDDVVLSPRSTAALDCIQKLSFGLWADDDASLVFRLSS